MYYIRRTPKKQPDYNKYWGLKVDPDGNIRDIAS